MNILITGALGFFGLNLTRLVGTHESIHVIAADVRQPTSEQRRFLQEAAGRVEFYPLDIQDREAIRNVFERWVISHVIHAAALTPTPEQEREQPTQIVDINLGGTVNLLDAAIRGAAVERVITVSSSGVYGASKSTDGSTQPEEGPLLLDNLYSMTKHSGELLTERYSQLSGISMTAVRLAPLYGPLERASQSRQRISGIGQLMDALKHGRAIRVGGPSIRRDWTTMVDAATALLALLEAKQLSYPVYNVGCGVAVSWRRVVDTFVAHGLVATWHADESNIEILMRPEQERLAMDISRLQIDTTFSPRVGIEEGIAYYIQEEERLLI